MECSKAECKYCSSLHFPHIHLPASFISFFLLPDPFTHFPLHPLSYIQHSILFPCHKRSPPLHKPLLKPITIFITTFSLSPSVNLTISYLPGPFHYALSPQVPFSLSLNTQYFTCHSLPPPSTSFLLPSLLPSSQSHILPCISPSFPRSSSPSFVPSIPPLKLCTLLSSTFSSLLRARLPSSWGKLDVYMHASLWHVKWRVKILHSTTLHRERERENSRSKSNNHKTEHTVNTLTYANTHKHP